MFSVLAEPHRVGPPRPARPRAQRRRALRQAQARLQSRDQRRSLRFPLLHYLPPLQPARNQQIAVKVINHYGDEVLKVYEVGG